MSSLTGPTTSHSIRSEPAVPSATLGILVVCAGNRCRSPAIVAALTQGAGGHPGLASGDVGVSSAGTLEAEGAAVDAKTRKALRKAGYTPPDTLSVTITPQMVASADLILTASRRHRTRVVRMVPDALGRTYTVREFARYCTTIMNRPTSTSALSPADHLQAAMVLAQQRRGMSLLSRVEDDDIPDPAGRSRWVHARTIRLIVATVAPILAVASSEPPPGRRRALR